MASEWSPLSDEEASAVGNNVKDKSGLGNPNLRVAKLFPLKDDKPEWFLGGINVNFHLKHFFWVTFVEDESEYRIPFYPKKYNKEWCFVRANKAPLHADEPSP